MNKILAKLVAAGLVAVSLAAVACNAQKTPSQLAVNTPDAVSDASPTPAELISQSPTEVPTPTEEPTATPIPEGWYIDPRGIIPPEVEIVVPADQPGYCITQKDGKAFVQYWEKDGLKKEWEVPAEMLNTTILDVQSDWFQEGDIFAAACLTEDRFGPFLFFYQDKNGKTLYFECNDIYAWPDGIRIATTDSKAVMYSWGDEYYMVHDFGMGTNVKVTSNGNFGVNGNICSIDDISWTKINM